MKPATDPEEFTRLVSRLFDAGLTEQERSRLEQVLEADGESRRLYMHLADMQVKLSCLVSPSVEADEEEFATPVAVTSKPAFPWRWAVAASAVAAALIFLLATRNRPAELAETNANPVPVRNVVTSAKQTIPPDSAPDAWSEAFEAGPVEGWIGRWTNDGLPAASSGGIQSITLTNRLVRFHRISPPRWNVAGLFTVRSNSHLRMTYKVESPTWFNVFLGTRPEDPGEPPYVLHLLAHDRLWLEAGRWRLAVIPLQRFQRKVDGVFTDAPPAAGEAAIDLFFSSVDTGLQLTIDRIEITPDGPGTIQISDLE